MVDKDKSPASCGGISPPSPSGLIPHGHRRAHSEILTLPDDLNFDNDLGVVNTTLDEDSFSDWTEEDLQSLYLDMENVNTSAQFGEPLGTGERPRVRHQHSLCMDGINTEMLMSGNEDDSIAVDGKKSFYDIKLAEIARTDPKRAKRMLANRQSAARSKERRTKYIFELEKEVQTLKTEATTLSAQLTLVQRDANGLAIKNNELKRQLQSMEQQVHFQDKLNNELKEEIQQLKMLTGEVAPSGSSGMNYGSFGSNLPAQQFQQLQIHSQKQQQQHQFQSQQQQMQQLMQHRIQQKEQEDRVAYMKRNNPSQAQKEN